ncbi:LysR family transcriptional regulator [soil metagenome]
MIPVFLAVWELRSLTLAAERLGITQPAVSHALRRLRLQFNDPLFVRSSNEMIPTEAATRLHLPLSQALRIIEDAAAEQGTFDPAESTRTFRVAMSDVAESCYLPPLLTALEKLAPRVHIESARLDAASIETALRSGTVDVAIGYLPNCEDACISRQLMTDTFVCLVRRGHPIADAPLTMAAFTSLRFVYGSVGATGHQMVERWLDEQGIERQTALRIAHFTVAPEVIRQTDLGVVFPRSLAGRINRDGAFLLLPLPFEAPPIHVDVHIHANFQSDLGIRWLSATLLELDIAVAA